MTMQVGGAVRAAGIGLAVGGAAVATGIAAGIAGHDHWYGKVAARGDGPALDDWGLPGGFPDATGLLSAIGAGGITALLARDALRGGPRATFGGVAGGVAAGAALGAAAGWFIGRRIGVVRAEGSEEFRRNETARLAERTTARDQERAQRERELEAAARAETEAAFRVTWGSGAASGASGTQVAAADAPDPFFARYDHDGDDSIDLRDGQPMVADERVMRERYAGLGGGGPVDDDDDRVRTHFTYLRGLDANDDGSLARTEAARMLAERYDTDHDGTLTADELPAFPQGETFGDYNDFADD